MKTIVKRRVLILLAFVFYYFVTLQQAHATHSEGADITYKCLGGNQYEITVSFYRDCHGVAAPGAAAVNCSSLSTGQNFNLNLQPIPGTGQEIPIVCASAITECQGGTYPGVQEWVYKGITTLSPAIDWVFSFNLCCRNAAITTIVNPGGQNIYIESTLDNLNFPCNSSPIFSTKPVPFVCLNQNYTFNHGASDPDGDDISYELITPMNAPGSSVTYIAPYSAVQPLTTASGMSFDTLTGDINMNPSMLEVTVLAVKVKQWKNNRLVGYTIRDIQLRTMNCSNTYPYISGISGTWSFITNACTGTNLTFNVYAYDPDSAQTVTITWSNTIAGATFIVTPGQNPMGTFSWTPGANDIGTHCMTITVTDDNCPINGSQTFSICLVVSGFEVSLTTTNANCGANNGTATSSITGGIGPFNYHWLPCGCHSSSLNGLGAGTYTLIVTDAGGCTAQSIATVNNGSAPGNTTMSFTPASCKGGAGGTASVNANGGQPPYSYQWSNGDSTQTITGLSAGNYFVTVTTAQGCIKKDSVTVTEPQLLVTSVSASDALCFGADNGTASASSSGGTVPYAYHWSNGNSTQFITGLASGNYFVTVTDANGCSNIQNVYVGEPDSLRLAIFSQTPVSCYGGNNGTASAVAYGGIGSYTYVWSTTPGQTSQTATGLSAGNYNVLVLDSNGCKKTIAFNIGQSAPISSTINSLSVTCNGTSTGSASVNPSGGSLPYSYLWSTGQTSSSASNLFAGTYSVIVTDMYGCSHINTATISEPAPLSGAITNIHNVSCNNIADGSAAVYVNGGITPYHFSWNNGQTTSAISGLAGGSYNVAITDANECKATFIATITQPAAMVITVSTGTVICPGQNTSISATAAGGTMPYTYFWQPNVGFGNSQAVSPAANTTYTAIVTDAHGCTNTGTVTVSVHDMSLGLTVNTPPAICSGETATLLASSSSNSALDYYWNNSIGVGAGPHLVWPVMTTTYSVTAINICGAKETVPVTVVVHPLPQLFVPPQSLSACGKAVLNFQDTNPANTGSDYVWNFGDGASSTLSNPSHNYSHTGEYTLSVTVVSPYGCSSFAESIYSVEVFPYPEANFTSDPPLKTSVINPDFHFYDKSQNATAWNWSFGDGDTSAETNPFHKYKEVGVYTVKLVTRNAGGCIDSILKTIEVKPEFTFYIPNTFTPNGDEVNDNFTGKGMEIVEFSMSIFDRWGEEIYNTNDLAKGWDGTVRGGDIIAQEGVYVYQVRLKDFEGTEHRYNGHVNLVK